METIKVADIQRIVFAETGADWLTILNKNLIQLGRQKNIKILDDAPLVPSALQASWMAGARGLQDITEVGLEAISRVCGRTPMGGGILDNNPDYLRNTVLVSLIQSMKADGKSLERIMKDQTVKTIIDKLGVRDSTLKKYYEGRTLPNRLIQNIKEIGLRKTKQRGSVFDEFDPHLEKDFTAFFRRVVQNEASTILSERNRLKDRIINDALRIGPDTESGEIAEDRHSELSVDELEKHESYFLAKRLKEELRKTDPKYLTVLKLMKEDDLDMTESRDYGRFQKELGLNREQFTHFQRQFLDDLKRIFSKLDLTADDADLALKAAKKRAQGSAPNPTDYAELLAQEIHDLIETHFAQEHQRILTEGISCS